MIKVMFVCHGNICRSPMAEYVLRHLVTQRGISEDFKIASSATSREEIGNDIHHGTRRKLKEQGISFFSRQATQLTKKDYEDYDYIIAMDSMNVRNIMRIIGEDKDNKVCRLLDFTNRPRDIADPWYTGNFDLTYSDVVEGCEAFLKKVEKSI